MGEGGQLSVTIGLRGYYARFLDKSETKIYEQHGDDSWFNHKTGKLIEPEVEEEEKYHDHK